MCVHRLPQDPPSTTTKLGQSPRNKREKDRNKRKGQRGKARCGRVNRSGRIERQRQTRGKRPTCTEGDQDGWKETHGEERDEGGWELWRKTVKNSPSVKLPASWRNSHLQWSFYSKPLWSVDSAQKLQHNATCWNISGTIWDIKQLVHALGNGLVCS